MAHGRIEKRSLPGYVVSIGNLTVGGTGKTPAACWMAQLATNEGYRVAILSRGYGGKYRTEVLEVSNGDRINAGPVDTGDEPYLLAKRLRGVPVVISKDRHMAGLFAHKRFGSDFFILDDAFQYLTLERDLDLVLIDANDPFGNGHLLPWGPLREPVKQLERADTLIITRSSSDSGENDLEEMLNARFPHKPLFKGDHVAEKVVFPFKSKGYDPDYLRGKRVMAFAGIARPEAFKETLVKLGTDLLFFKGFRDHHSFSPSELSELKAEKEKIKADYLLTTEKDWVRLEGIASEYSDLAYLQIRFHLLSSEDRFFSIIKKGLAKRRD